MMHWRMGLILAATLLARPAQAEAWRIGMVTPPSHRWTQGAIALSEALKVQTEGRIELAVFPAGQLGPEAQLLQLLQSGALDMAFLTVGELASRDADFGALTAPYLVDGGEAAAKLLEGPTATALQGKLGALGLHGLGYGMAGMRIVILSQPLGADGRVAGRKIRTVPLPQELDFWTKAGAAPTPIPLPDLFDAYVNGQIDGMQIDFEGVWNTRFHDHSAVVLDSEHMIFPMVAVFSARKWAALTPEDQAVVTRLVGEETARIRAEYPGIDAAYRAKLVADGAEVVTPDASLFGGAVEAWYAEWRVKTPVLVALEAEAAALRD